MQIIREENIDSSWLPRGWKLSERVVTRGPALLGRPHLVGLEAVSSFGAVTGSASASDRIPMDRAYFELLERIVLVEHLRLEKNTLASSKRVLSKSNGVALAPTVREAQVRAWAELFERHCCLSSWYRWKKPLLLERTFDFGGIENNYSIAFYELGREPIAGTVVCCIGFPRQTKVTDALLGFGSSLDLRVGMEKSFNEALQRAGFLWDEPPVKRLLFKPHPDYHMERFRGLRGQSLLRAWLRSSAQEKGRANTSSPQFSQASFETLRRGRISDRGSFAVVRANHPRCTPLFFGKPPSQWVKAVPSWRATHPVA